MVALERCAWQFSNYNYHDWLKIQRAKHSQSSDRKCNRSASQLERANDKTYTPTPESTTQNKFGTFSKTLYHNRKQISYWHREKCRATEQPCTSKSQAKSFRIFKTSSTRLWQQVERGRILNKRKSVNPFSRLYSNSFVFEQVSLLDGNQQSRQTIGSRLLIVLWTYRFSFNEQCICTQICCEIVGERTEKKSRRDLSRVKARGKLGHKIRDSNGFFIDVSHNAPCSKQRLMHDD